MRIEGFEGILSWRKSKELANEVYAMFNEEKVFGFRNQIERASVSVLNNIAEGFERQTKKEFKQFSTLNLVSKKRLPQKGETIARLIPASL